MSTSAQIPMLDKNGNPGMVDADKVDAAKAAGYEPAAKMVGPKGEIGYVAQSKVSAARQSNYAVTPDNPGVTRMADPNSGNLNYVLPAEVDNFKSLGHVPIDDKGNFNVEPLPGEDNFATMDRAAKLAQKLPPDVMKKAIAAEQKTFTAKRLAANLIAAPAVLGLAAPTAAAAGLEAAPVAIGTTAGTAVKLATSPVGQAVIKEGGKYLVKAVGLGAGYALVRKFMKALGD